MSPRKTNAEAYLRMYRQMVRIRVFEDNANQLYLSARMPGLTHMYSGQEAVAVGICEALTRDDKITSTHRGHGHCVAKGAEFKEMFCELLGRAEGYCGGKGGSMHIADQSNGNLGANAIVGGSMGIATGAALSAKRLGRKDVTVCFFGDGATAQGLLYEVMNMAALWKLPVIYACENNGYSEYTKTAEIAAGSLLARAEAFGIEAFQVDGQDVLAVNELTERLVARCRNGEGPFFVQLDTYRYHGHHVGDINREYYRSKDEEALWKTERDPIVNFGRWLTAEGVATSEELAAIEKDPEAFLAGLDDPEAKGPPITLPDGSKVPRLPGFRRWIWDGEASGSIGMRWQAGTSALPPHVLGHIGYSVVPWKQRRGYATQALRLMLDEARAVGLGHVELTTDPDNPASGKVILANGGKLVRRFKKVAAYGDAESLLYRIDL